MERLCKLDYTTICNEENKMIKESIIKALDVKHLIGFAVIDYVLYKNPTASRNNVEETYRFLVEERIYNGSAKHA